MKIPLCSLYGHRHDGCLLCFNPPEFGECHLQNIFVESQSTEDEQETSNYYFDCFVCTLY